MCSLWVKCLLLNSFARNFGQDPSPVIQIHSSHMSRYFECFFNTDNKQTNLTVTSVVQLVLFNAVELHGVSLAGVLLALSVPQITVTITRNTC